MFFFLFYGLILLNLVTFVLFALDKRKAVRGKWRIPETLLLILSVLGGSMGALMAMSLFRHKTQKKLFSIGIPLVFILHIILTMWLILSHHWA